MTINLAEAQPLKVVKEYRKIPTKTLAEINGMDFPPPEFLVEGLIPKVGMGLLVGNPKAGKSFMALQLITCIAKGVPFMGRDVLKGSVMYLALEDPRARLDWRSKATQELLGVTNCENLEINCQNDDWLATVANGGLDSLQGWIDETPDARVIVIDTIQIFQGVRKGGADSYQLDVEAFSPIQTLAMRNGISIICVHHMNKAGAVMGSQGFEGTADWTMKLWKEEEEPTALLQCKGRDFEEFAETLERKKVTPDDERGYIWNSLGEAHKYRGTLETEEVFKAGNFIEMDKHSRKLGSIALTLDELHADLPHIKKATLSKRLERMVKRNELESPNKKYYWISILHFTIGYDRTEEETGCPQ